MGVVFDEVVTRVEPPQQSEPQPQQERGDEQQSPQTGLQCRQQQAIIQRRQQRLEAD